MDIKSKIQFLGPGVLYAAAAIGVSHLVQSTRAGANYGFELFWVIIIANLLKYPFYKIGPIYTSITQKSLLNAYREQGKLAIVLFLILSISTMFIIQAAITIVTAGLFAQITGVDFSLIYQSAFILLASVLLINLGKYKLLDSFIKIVVCLLTISTFIAVINSLELINTPIIKENYFSFSNKSDIFFLIAFIGWMPAPMDIPVWQSLWSVEKIKETKPDIKLALLDFKIGFFITALLAFGFLALGALVMYPAGTNFPSSATGFSASLINLYTKTLGDSFSIFISIAALTTMFSTTLTCLDAFGRITAGSFEQLDIKGLISSRKLWTVLTAICSLIILIFFIKDMKELVDLATTISFLAAPFYAYLNFKIIKNKELLKHYSYNRIEMLLTYLGLAFFCIFSTYYIYIKFLE